MIALRDRMQWLAPYRPVRDFQANHVPMHRSGATAAMLNNLAREDRTQSDDCPQVHPDVFKQT
jgi:hypothetical protein